MCVRACVCITSGSVGAQTEPPSGPDSRPKSRTPEGLLWSAAGALTGHDGDSRRSSGPSGAACRSPTRVLQVPAQRRRCHRGDGEPAEVCPHTRLSLGEGGARYPRTHARVAAKGPSSGHRQGLARGAALQLRGSHSDFPRPRSSYCPRAGKQSEIGTQIPWPKGESGGVLGAPA